MKRPRASIASAAASAIRRAAVSASASGSGTTVTVGFEPMPQPSYPVVEAALPLERVAVARVAGAVGDERLAELLARGGEVRQDSEGLEGEERGAATGRLALRRPPDRLAEGVGGDLRPHAGPGQGAARRDDRGLWSGARRQQVVDEREPERHSLECRAGDLERRRVEPQARDDTDPVAPPAGSALAGPVRQHGEAVVRGRQRGERRLDLVVPRQLQHLPTPRVDVAPLGGRAPEERAAAVEPVAPEAVGRHGRGGGHYPQRGGRPDVEGDARGVDAVRADVAGGDVAHGGKPVHPAERGPAELGRPVRGVQVAAGASVDGRIVERAAQELGLRHAAGVRPHVDRRRGMAAAVEAEEPVPEGRDTDRPDGSLVPRKRAVEARRDGLEQPGRVVLDAAVPRDGGLVRDLTEPPWDGPARGVVEARTGGRGPDVEGDDHCGKIAPMAETWEVLTLRGLASTDERAQEFTGTLVIHRVGSTEPVESIQVSIKRSVLTELYENLGRLLARSIGVTRRKG